LTLKLDNAANPKYHDPRPLCINGRLEATRAIGIKVGYLYHLSTTAAWRVAAKALRAWKGWYHRI
jgi:hypothetical protein